MSMKVNSKIGFGCKSCDTIRTVLKQQGVLPKTIEMYLNDRVPSVPITPKSFLGRIFAINLTKKRIAHEKAAKAAHDRLFIRKAEMMPLRYHGLKIHSEIDMDLIKHLDYMTKIAREEEKFKKLGLGQKFSAYL